MPERPIFLPHDLRADWDLIVRARSNLLLAGSASATNAMVVALKPHLPGPLQQFKPKAGVPVPQPREGTLVLREVARLTVEQQAELLRWLGRFDDRSRVQVISTTAQPLFSLVESGAFLDNLYYRLNTVRMDLVSSGKGTP